MDKQEFLNEFYSNEIEIVGYTLNETIIFNSNKRVNVKVVKDCKFNAGGIFNNIKSYGKLTFDNCIFFGSGVGNNLIELSIKERHHLIFTNCTFHCDVNFKFPDSKKIWILDCKFKGELIIEKPSQKDELDFRLKDSTANKVFFKYSTFQSIIINKSKLSSLIFNKVAINSINIYEGTYNLISFNNCNNLNELNIRNTSFDRQLININKLYLKNINLTGSIRIQGATIKNYNISPFNNEQGRFVHQNISFLEEVIMMDSDLSDVQFNEVDFSNENLNLCLDNSYLSDTVFSNILWPTSKEVTHYSDTSTYKEQNKPEDWKTKNLAEKALIKKEIYRQLKNSSKSESNNIDALDFYRNEMDSYWSYIKGNKEIDFWDRVLIRIARISSNFGISYIRPLLCLLSLHLIVFLLILLFGDYNGCQIDIYNSSWEYFEKSFNSYWELIIPVRKFGDDLPAWVDVLMRIYSGFFIYHIIRGTRKFAKL